MMKKIMIVGGLGSSLLRFRGELIKSWLEKGYRVTAVAPGREAEGTLKSLGVAYYTVPLSRTGMNPLHDFMVWIKMIWLLKRERADYLFLYTVKPVIYGSLAAVPWRRVKVFSMITGLGYVFSATGVGKLQKLVIFLYRLALRRNEKVFFQNPDDEELFKEKKLVLDNQVARVNGSGVNLTYFQPESLPEGAIQFLLIARLLAEKGIREYVQAARILRARYSEPQYALVGWAFENNPAAIGPDEIERWRKEGVVEIFDETEDVRPFIAGSSVYVLPSYREGTPRTVLEAMAMGRPVVTTDTPGCRETVKEGFNGFLVPVKDPGALAEAMEKFILEPGLVASMGKASRSMAVEKYDVHKVNRVINETMGLL